MTLDQVILAIIYLISVFVVFAAGKVAFDLLRPRFRLQRALFDDDNVAVAASVAGYFAGLVAVIGGVIVGPSHGIVRDVIDVIGYGLLGVILLNLSAVINDKLILFRFDVQKEILTDRNLGTGAIEAGNFVATGLITAGALMGEGNLLTAAVFWLIGQIVLIVAALLYELITPFNVHDEIERDNVAVGIAFAGMLIGIGNVVRIGIMDDFTSWASNLYFAGWFIVVALVAMPLVRFVTDKVLAGGANLTSEVTQERPNVGAGVLEALAYVAASFLLGWVL